MPASENGWTGSRWWPITSAGVSIVRRSLRCGAMRPKNRPCSTAALGAGSWRTVSRPMSSRPREPRHALRARRTSRISRLAGGQGEHQRREGDRAAEQRVVEHRHLDDHAAQALGRRARPPRAPRSRPATCRSTTASSTSEVVEQRDDLLAEGRHRVAPHVARAVRAAVAEQVERDDAVAALGERARQRRVHALAEQQAVDEHGHPRALAVDRVGEPVAGEREGALGGAAGIGAGVVGAGPVWTRRARCVKYRSMRWPPSRHATAAGGLLRRSHVRRAARRARARGSDAAFEAIFERHHRAVLALCRHMLGSHQEAEDAVQHTFLAAYRGIRRRRPRDPPAAVAVRDRPQPLPRRAARPPRAPARGRAGARDRAPVRRGPAARRPARDARRLARAARRPAGGAGDRGGRRRLPRRDRRGAGRAAPRRSRRSSTRRVRR